MDALPLDVKRELVRRAFPVLRFGGDPDIERYFELRRSGRMGEALDLYAVALRARYPGDASRVALFRLYRERDPRFAAFLDSLQLSLADRLTLRVKANIDSLAARLHGAELSDAFGALKAAEALVATAAPGGGEVETASRTLETYRSLGALIGYRERELEKAVDLVREYEAIAKADQIAEYDFVARSSSLEERRRATLASEPRFDSAHRARREEPYDFIAKSAEREERRRESERERARYFDTSKIRFSPLDRARVEIPSFLTRREDRILALCGKYWNQVADQAFERIVFLYSRKYGTRHYEVFKRVKLGRLRRDTDDEILNAVSTILSTRYSYSVTGDIYMQFAWRRLKAKIEAGAEAAGPAPSAARGPRAAAAPIAVWKRRPTGQTSAAPGAARPSVLGTTHDATATGPRLTVASPGATSKRLTARGPAKTPILPPIKAAKGSVSDKIRILSGRAYDVYRDIFLERVRDDIHRTLLANQTRSHGIFDTSANEAEDRIFEFMSDHYADPFMDWETSPDRSSVEALGFSLPSLDPIIAACFRRL